MLTGVIKANLPSRISFRVSSKIDSRTILGEPGAEQLLGQGDMLYLGDRIARIHGALVTDAEVERVVRHLKAQGPPDYEDDVTREDGDDGPGADGPLFEARGGGDGVYKQAVQVVVKDGKASTSYLQRKLQIGYNSAAKLIERMEADGLISSADHVGRRQVLTGAAASTATSRPTRSDARAAGSGRDATAAWSFRGRADGSGHAQDTARGASHRIGIGGNGGRVRSASLGTGTAAGAAPHSVHRGEPAPPIGLGTWITFNVGDDPLLRDECADVLAAFFEAGGRMVDSFADVRVVPAGDRAWPEAGGQAGGAVAADKVWTSDDGDASAQVERSRQLWGVPRFDLLQVHNLLAWESRLAMLQEMKAAGQVRYIGITTSEGRRHDLFEQIMRTPATRLRAAHLQRRRSGCRAAPPAIGGGPRHWPSIVNRPFPAGSAHNTPRRTSLCPGGRASSVPISWAQAILKFIVAHPAVPSAIPATSRVDHLRENVAAAVGPLPDAALRQRIVADVRER